MADAEVNEIAGMFPTSDVLTGDDATFEAFRLHAKGRDLVHLACHGTFRPDNPTFSSLHLADGRVTVRDLLKQRLDAGLVTLSACETGLSSVYAGNEVLGLVRGFLSAGAGSLVASLWNINDSLTAILMTELYTHLQRGDGVAASLRKAQLKLVAQGEHPYYWAAFFAIE
jgi:CHAT domain-containing protein